MKKIKSIGLVLTVIALLIPTTLAFAKGLSGMDISGPGINGTLHLSDLDQMEDIMRSNFFDMSGQIRLSDAEIAALGEGYNVTFYLSEQPDMEPFHIENVVYYPDPEGGRGYIHWIGGGDPTVEIMAADQWSRASASGEQTFWRIMEANGITQSAIAAPAPAVMKAEVVQFAAQSEESAPPVAALTTQTAPINWTGIGAGVVLITLLGAGAWLIRKRQDRHMEPSAASD